jgi:ArsR family transcriptional regulator, arsenate/arsenite/antimonite-responsive transcriptional repressor
MNLAHINHLPDTWTDAATLYTAIGDTHRQKILMMFEPGEKISLSRIADAMPLSRSAVMHHLKILRAADAVTAWRDGKELFYAVNKQRFTQVLGDTLDYLKDHPMSVG